MLKKNNPLLGALILLLANFMAGKTARAGSIESIYTDLSTPPCKTVSTDKETGASTEKCPGVGGYTLLTHYDDERQSVSVVTPGGKEQPLNFWDVITHGFSDLGKKAEWRAVQKEGKTTPTALIVRVNARSDTGPSLSYLAVAKITPTLTCVTDRVEPGPKANEEARQKADSSAARPCLAPLK